MSMGFGKVPVEDWEKVKTGSSVDLVEPGDYFGVVSAVRHIEPTPTRPLGAFIVQFTLSEENAEAVRDKKIECRISYHPDPSQAKAEKVEGYIKMNDMSNTVAASLIDATNVEPAVENGIIDVVASLNKLAALSPKVLCCVSHELYEGKTQQRVGGFRPTI
jgi:hypothetical protein